MVGGIRNLNIVVVVVVVVVVSFSPLTELGRESRTRKIGSPSHAFKTENVSLSDVLDRATICFHANCFKVIFVCIRGVGVQFWSLKYEQVMYESKCRQEQG